jgi:hypothetical protein
VLAQGRGFLSAKGTRAEYRGFCLSLSLCDQPGLFLSVCHEPLMDCQWKGPVAMRQGWRGGKGHGVYTGRT